MIKILYRPQQEDNNQEIRIERPHLKQPYGHIMNKQQQNNRLRTLVVNTTFLVKTANNTEYSYNINVVYIHIEILYKFKRNLFLTYK